MQRLHILLIFSCNEAKEQLHSVILPALSYGILEFIMQGEMIQYQTHFLVTKIKLIFCHLYMYIKRYCDLKWMYESV